MALCYVTLAAFENLLIRLCVGISIHGIATEDLTVKWLLIFCCLVETNHKAAGFQNNFIFCIFLNLNNSRAKLSLKHIFNGHQCDQEIIKVRE